jgi:hypothetical protein
MNVHPKHRLFLADKNKDLRRPLALKFSDSNGSLNGRKGGASHLHFVRNGLCPDHGQMGWIELLHGRVKVFPPPAPRFRPLFALIPGFRHESGVKYKE